MDKKEIERLHNAGKIPDRYYNQMNGKSMTENLFKQRKKSKERYQKKKQIDREMEIYKARRKAEIEQQINDEITPMIEKALDEILKDWE